MIKSVYSGARDPADHGDVAEMAALNLKGGNGGPHRQATATLATDYTYKGPFPLQGPVLRFYLMLWE